MSNAKQYDPDEAQRVIDAATPGPWEASIASVYRNHGNLPPRFQVEKLGENDWRRICDLRHDGNCVASCYTTRGKLELEEANAIFIAAARTLWPVANAAVRELQAAQPTCQFCDAPATCVGYGEDAPYGFACDDHCGHGGEDGQCWTVVEFVAMAERLRRSWDEQEEQLAERDARIAELESDCTEWKNIRDGWEETAALLRTERDEAREIARKYGQHKPGCDVYAKSDGDDKRPLPCTCGYDEARKTMEAWFQSPRPSQARRRRGRMTEKQMRNIQCGLEPQEQYIQERINKLQRRWRIERWFWWIGITAALSCALWSMSQ